VCLFLAVGSFSGGGAEGGSINDLPLFRWLRETPFVLSWWLWVAIALLALLALNTVLCSIESVRMKYRRTGFLILIAPQVMHAGFLLIVLAHLFSAWGGYKQVMPVQEGGVITCPDGSRGPVAPLPARYSSPLATWCYCTSDGGGQILSERAWQKKRGDVLPP